MSIAAALVLRQVLQRRNRALAQLQGLEHGAAEDGKHGEKLKLAQANFRYLV